MSIDNKIASSANKVNIISLTKEITGKRKQSFILLLAYMIYISIHGQKNAAF